MLCSKPYTQGVAEYPCGRCAPCLIRRKRLWTCRMLLESQLHEQSCFVTLTFSELWCPDDRSLSKRPLQLWFKRLRRKGLNIRYFGVGEYGDLCGRPHYHVALFGFNPADHIDPSTCRIRRVRCSCVLCESWLLGSVDVGTITKQSAAYIASYVTKDCRKVGDVRLNGKAPEFAVMSTHPGIGADSTFVIAEKLFNEYGANYLIENGDVPPGIRFDSVVWPLGRYLRQQLRIFYGSDKETPREWICKNSEEKAQKLRLLGAKWLVDRRRRDAEKARARIKCKKEKELS